MIRQDLTAHLQPAPVNHIWRVRVDPPGATPGEPMVPTSSPATASFFLPQLRVQLRRRLIIGSVPVAQRTSTHLDSTEITDAIGLAHGCLTDVRP